MHGFSIKGLKKRRLLSKEILGDNWVFDQRFRMKRKTWRIPLSRLLKVKDFDSISYVERITKEDERA